MVSVGALMTAVYVSSSSAVQQTILYVAIQSPYINPNDSPASLSLPFDVEHVYRIDLYTSLL